MSLNPTWRAKSGGPARQPEHSHHPAIVQRDLKLKSQFVDFVVQFKSQQRLN
jgi:hypothetical protein